jgi:hypothetical protein
VSPAAVTPCGPDTSWEKDGVVTSAAEISAAATIALMADPSDSRFHDAPTIELAPGSRRNGDAGTLVAVIYTHKILSVARSLLEIYLMDIFSFGGKACGSQFG